MQMRGTERLSQSHLRGAHIGPNQEEIDAMLGVSVSKTWTALIEAAIPESIRLNRELDLPEAKSRAKR